MRCQVKTVPTLDSVREQIDAMFSPARRQRAIEWAATPEGRETLAAQHEAMKSLPKPVPPTGG